MTGPTNNIRYALGLGGFFLLSVQVWASPIAECMVNAMEKSQTPGMEQRLATMKYPGEIVMYVESNKKEWCTNLIKREMKWPVKPTNCLINTPNLFHAVGYFGVETLETKARYVPSMSPNDLPYSFTPPLPTCMNELVAEDLVQKNQFLASKYQALKENEKAEALAAAERDAALNATKERIKSAKEHVVDFRIKDLGLNTTKSDLDRISGNDKNFWRCQAIPNEPNSQACVAGFTLKACYGVERGNPIAGYVPGTQCDTHTIDPTKLPPNKKRIATIGGVPVETIMVEFYDGKLIGLVFSMRNDISKSTVIANGFSEMYGEPTELDSRTGAARWHSKHSVLGLTDSRIYVDNTSLLASKKQKIEDLRQRALIDRGNSERIKQKQAEKDF